MSGEPGQIHEWYARCFRGECGQPSDGGGWVGGDRPPIHHVLADGLHAFLLLCESRVGGAFHPEESALQFWGHASGVDDEYRIPLTP
jgi:hypothetical protein